MRIRGTKPEFYSSELIARIPWEYRFLLKGLESYVDDNGVGKDDVALIVADICPRDMFANPRETVARVSEGISVIHQAGMLWRYEADGLKLLYVSFFDSAQRIDKPNKGRYRRPDGTMEYRESVIGEYFAEPSRGFATTSDTLAPVTEEQRNRGTEEKQTCATVLRDPTPPRFDEFWTTYPRRRDRRKAEKAFTAALKRADADTIIAGAYRYATDPNRQDQYTKYAEGWLNGDGWLDEPLPARRINGSGTITAPSDARIARVQALKTTLREITG